MLVGKAHLGSGAPFFFLLCQIHALFEKFLHWKICDQCREKLFAVAFDENLIF